MAFAYSVKDAVVLFYETEGMNNLLKRIKRVAFGFTNLKNFRIRALLYAGTSNFGVLDSIVVT